MVNSSKADFFFIQIKYEKVLILVQGLIKWVNVV